MAMPRRYEYHHTSCAICGETMRFSTNREVSQYVESHQRTAHRMYSSHRPNASRTITIIFQNEDPEMEQEPSHTDPTMQFLKFMNWLNEREAERDNLIG